MMIRQILKKGAFAACLLIGTAQGAAQNAIEENRSACDTQPFFGYAYSCSGRAVSTTRHIAPHVCAIAFLYSEHPTLLKDDRMDMIVSHIISTESPTPALSKAELKIASQAFKQKVNLSFVNSIPTDELPIASDDTTGAYVLGLYDIILTKRWIYVSRLNVNKFGMFNATGPQELGSDRYFVDHHVANGYLTGSFSGSQESLEGQDAQTKALLLQTQNPEKPFHIVIDNIKWAEHCDENDEPIGDDELAAESAMKDFALQVAYGLK